VGGSLWREDGSAVYNCCWSSPAQSFLGPSPAALVTKEKLVSFCLYGYVESLHWTPYTNLKGHLELNITEVYFHKEILLSASNALGIAGRIQKNMAIRARKRCVLWNGLQLFRLVWQLLHYNKRKILLSTARIFDFLKEYLWPARRVVTPHERKPEVSCRDCEQEGCSGKSIFKQGSLFPIRNVSKIISLIVVIDNIPTMQIEFFIISLYHWLRIWGNSRP
jgi:hypothetical protein